jgi:dTDP-glucose 4,6-dehydratase
LAGREAAAILTRTEVGVDAGRGLRVRVVVTGGAGFLGSHLSERLLAEGHSVVVVDNCSTGRLENIKHLLTNDNVTFFKADTAEPLLLDGPVDAVCHLASPASPTDFPRIPVAILKAGSLGTMNALELARQKGARLLCASSSEVYGDPLVHPQPEDYWGNVNPVGARSCYDEAKRFGEALVAAYHRSYDLDTGTARIFNTYGPRMRTDDGRVLPTLATQALRGEDLTVNGDGSQTRSFCYVADLVDGLYRLLMSPGVTEPINLGNPEEVTIEQFAQEVIVVTGSRSRIVHRRLPPDDPKVRCPDIARAKKLLGWQPRISRREGLELTVPWFREELIRRGLLT